MAESAQGGAFDPTAHFMKMRGGKDYLPVAWRLVWLRTEHPDAIIRTECVQLDHDRQFAMFKATVYLSEGGEASGYGSETRADFGDFIEKAETKAIGRALGALGFGTQFSEDFDFEKPDGSKVVDSPVNRGGHLLDEAIKLGGVQTFTERVQTPPAPNGNTPPSPGATEPQIKALHKMATDITHWSTAELEAHCQNSYGVANPASLSRQQASALFDWFKAQAQGGRR